MYNEYLAHHGIKGQKWGVRRYQNPDGSLTLEGYKHYYGDNPNARMTRFGVLDYKTGKMLYSNPSKKERKENIRRYKKDKKQYKEELKRARKTGTIKNTSNRTETLNRVIKEAQNTEEYRRFDAYDKNLSTWLEQLAKSNGIRSDQIVLSANDPVVKRHIELKKAAIDRGKKVAEGYLDDVADAAIKDLNLTKTDAAMDFIKEQLVNEGYYRMFD